MAYYDDGYMWAQEHTSYFPVDYQDPVSFSGYEPCGDDNNYDGYDVSVFYEPKSIDNDDYGYDNDYNYGSCHNWYSYDNPSINYFTQNYMEPKLIAYEPIACDTGYISYHTQYLVSYSKVDSGFNEPEFEEYDPTPYGGGYDIVSVYGKPIPPSDQTCYPRSKPKPIGLRPTLNNNLESEPLKTLKPKSEPESKPKLEPKLELEHVANTNPTPVLKPEPKPNPKPTLELEFEPKPVPALVPLPDPLELIKVGERKEEEYTYPDYGYDYPWPEYEHANATRLGNDYGYGKQVVQIPPCEYSPEVVDLCESIFGSWPCLARIRRQQMIMDNNNPGRSCPEIGQLNPWEECASYIFGRPLASYNV